MPDDRIARGRKSTTLRADDDLIARALELGAPMLAPEPALARRSELLLALADRVEELEGLLCECEAAGTMLLSGGDLVRCCPVCRVLPGPGHAPGCRLARALGRKEDQ